MSLLLPHFFCKFAFTFSENHPFHVRHSKKIRNATKKLKYRHVQFLEGCFTYYTLITKEFDSQFLRRGVSQLQLFTATFYLKLASLLERSSCCCCYLEDIFSWCFVVRSSLFLGLFLIFLPAMSALTTSCSVVCKVQLAFLKYSVFTKIKIIFIGILS